MNTTKQNVKYERVAEEVVLTIVEVQSIGKCADYQETHQYTYIKQKTHRASTIQSFSLLPYPCGKALVLGCNTPSSQPKRAAKAFLLPPYRHLVHENESLC